MPFVSKFNFEKFNLYLWKIQESEDVLKAGIKMNFSLKERLNCSGNLEHRKRILSIYQLLKTAGISEADLSHNSLGAPVLKSGLNISISHSKLYSGIVLSSFNVGIDIEYFRSKIINISPKFLNPNENSAKGNIEKLTLIWTSKEAIYKAYSKKELSFSKQIKIDKPFVIDKICSGSVLFNDEVKIYGLSTFKLDSHIVTVAYEKK